MATSVAASALCRVALASAQLPLPSSSSSRADGRASASVVCGSSRSLVALAPRNAGSVTCAAFPRAVVAATEAFAQQAAEKLVRELPELLEREAPGKGDHQRAARTTAESLSGFLKSYEGEIDAKALDALKGALLAQEFPEPYVQKVLLCVIGWVRTSLHKDWVKA